MSDRLQRGFSLVEVLMVASIILILGALTYSFLIFAISRADEASAVASLRALEAAEFQYAAQHPEYGFNSLDNLPLSDPALKAGFKHGYEFIITLQSAGANGPNEHFQITAMPAGLNELLAARTYYGDDSGAITFARGREPSARSLKVKIDKAQ
jgi:prepilin-type N-terminal cleavage/methylation domain-containing protein